MFGLVKFYKAGFYTYPVWFIVDVDGHEIEVSAQAGLLARDEEEIGIPRQILFSRYPGLEKFLQDECYRRLVNWEVE